MLRRILAFAVLAFGLFAATAAAEQLVKSFDVPQGAGAHDMAATPDGDTSYLSLHTIALSRTAR